jgi:ribosomal protein S7
MNFESYLEFKHFDNVFHLIKNNMIGKIIKKGKKIYAINIYNRLKCWLKKKTIKDANFLILISILNSLVKVHFIKVRFGGVKKEIPVPLKFERQVKFAINALFKLTKKNKSINIKKLANLICYSYKSKGAIISQNFKLYKKAKDNRVLLNFIKR